MVQVAKVAQPKFVLHQLRQTMCHFTDPPASHASPPWETRYCYVWASLYCYLVMVSQSYTDYFSILSRDTQAPSWGSHFQHGTSYTGTSTSADNSSLKFKTSTSDMVQWYVVVSTTYTSTILGYTWKSPKLDPDSGKTPSSTIAYLSVIRLLDPWTRINTVHAARS
jgi:hypothetical protein